MKPKFVRYEDVIDAVAHEINQTIPHREYGMGDNGNDEDSWLPASLERWHDRDFAMVEAY